jgi:DNA-binding GntR family transcriptional regulator
MSTAASSPGGQEPAPASKGLVEYLERTPAHGSTTDVITDALREAILDGGLPPRSWLREDELARQLGVSRTPVREALRRLDDEHLIVRAAHRGAMVAPMSMEDVLAVYSVRESLEGLAARMTAIRQPAGAVDALRRVQAQMVEAAENQSIDKLTKLNLEFHRVLREGSGNPYLQRFLLQVENAVRRFGGTTFDTEQRRRAMLAEHQGIIDAVAASDAELASTRAMEHMARARQVRVERLSVSAL